MNDPKKFLIGASCLAPQNSLCGFVTDFRFRHKFAFRFTLSTFDRLGLAPARLTVDDELCTPHRIRQNSRTPHHGPGTPVNEHTPQKPTEPTRHTTTHQTKPPPRNQAPPTDSAPQQTNTRTPQLMGVLWDGHTLAPPHPNAFVGDRSYTRVLEHWAPSNLTDENVKGKTHTLAVADFSMIQACALHHSALHPSSIKATRSKSMSSSLPHKVNGKARPLHVSRGPQVPAQVEDELCHEVGPTKVQSEARRVLTRRSPLSEVATGTCSVTRCLPPSLHAFSFENEMLQSKGDTDSLGDPSSLTSSRMSLCCRHPQGVNSTKVTPRVATSSISERSRWRRRS